MHLNTGRQLRIAPLLVSTNTTMVLTSGQKLSEFGAHCWCLHGISLSASDELKHIIGADTTRKGILRVFDMFQYQPMNRRLVYVFLEGFLETMFPQYKFPELFVKLHSRSPRIHRYSQKLKSSSLKRWQERTKATGHGPTRDTQTWELKVRVWGERGLRWTLRYACVISAPTASLTHTFSVKNTPNYPADNFCQDRTEGW